MMHSPSNDLKMPEELALQLIRVVEEAARRAPAPWDRETAKARIGLLCRPCARPSIKFPSMVVLS